MNIFNEIDLFLLQLVIVPFVVIGCGISVAIFTKKIVFSPIVTLILNISFEFWYQKTNYLDKSVVLSSWNILFPLISLFLSWVIVKHILQSKELSHKS